MQYTTEELALKSKQGDKVAFEALVKSFERPIYTLCYRFLGNQADAYDASQETFIRVYQKFHLYDTSYSFKPWLYKISANICRDFLKKQRPWEELDYSLESSWGNPVESLEKNQIQSTVEKAILRLPEKYRMVVILRHIKQLDYEAISQTLDLPLNTVKTHIRRAREILRTELKEVE